MKEISPLLAQNEQNTALFSVPGRRIFHGTPPPFTQGRFFFHPSHAPAPQAGHNWPCAAPSAPKRYKTCPARTTPKSAFFRQQGEFCLGPTQNPLLPGKFHLAHGRRSKALRSLRLPPHRRCLVAGVWLGASSRSPARPRHSPRASQISRVKPVSPLLARARVGLKPTSPLRVKNGCFWRVFRLQRCHRFQRLLFGGEQRCHWFQWLLFGGEQW